MNRKMRFVLMFMCAALVVFTFMPAPAQAAGGGCASVNGKSVTRAGGSGPVAVANGNFIAGDTISITLSGTAGDTGNLAVNTAGNVVSTGNVPGTFGFIFTSTFSGQVFVENTSATNAMTFTIKCSNPEDANKTGPVFDDRLCDWGILGAVYVEEEGVFVYSINADSEGVIATASTTSDINNANAGLVASSANGHYAIIKGANDTIQVRGGADAEGKIFELTFRGPVPEVNDLACGESRGAPNSAIAQPGVGTSAQVPANVAAATASDTSTAGVTVTGDPVDIYESGYGIVNASYLNIRSGDGPGFTVLGVLDGGTIITEFLGRNEKGTWWLIRANGVEGWVNNVHLLLRGDLTNVPVVPSGGVLIAPTAVIAFEGNLLAVAPESTKSCVVAPGEYLVVGRSKSSTWFEIIATCEDGAQVQAWIEASNVVIRNPAGSFIPVTFP